MIRLRRPDVPSGFEADPTIVAARDKVRGLAGGELKSKDFPSCWSERRFKAFFEGRACGKCAFCEVVHIKGGYLQVEHYRPKTEVKELPPLDPSVYDAAPALWKEREDEGDEADPRGAKRRLTGGGYWWLAYAWANWLLSCEKCNSIKWKGNLFPARARLGGPRPDLREGCDADEDALLLNPFDTAHDPADHLSFTEDGFVVPRGRSERGAETIRTCGLNREALVRARRDKANAVVDRCVAFREALTEADAERALLALMEEATAEAEFAAVARAVIEAWLGRDFVDAWVA